MNVIITGATSGFGRAIAQTLIARGHTVVATGRRLPLLESLQKECGERLHIAKLDVTSAQAVTECFAHYEKTLSGIDVLVNNAGLALGLSGAHEAKLEDWERMVDTNIKGLMYCTHAVLPGMVSRHKGWIFNMGSIAGTYPYPGGNVYGATKAFVKQFTLNLRADLINTGLHITNIEPGLCGGTEFSLVRFAGDTQAANKVYENTQPLNAQDIAETIAWLLDLPSHININRIELMPTCQASGPLNIKRS